MVRTNIRAGITMGDPAGIGPEVALKAINAFRDDHVIPILIGRFAVLEKYFPDLVKRFNVLDFSTCTSSDFNTGTSYIIDVPDPAALPHPGDGSIDTGRESLRYIDIALDLWRKKIIDVIVTGPVHKGFIQKSGINFTGHTEYIAHAIGETNPRMMMFSRDYRVLLVTTHIPVQAIPGALNLETIIATIREGNRAVTSIDGGSVRLAITGLDPHCGDDGAIGTFDMEVTRKAVEICRKEGIRIDGPFAADTLFLPDRWKGYNLVIAYYHDQGLIPFKALAFDTGVNVTLGLSITRTSVDHGTAFDIAGKGVAGYTSMIEAIKLACLLEAGKSKHKN